MSSYCGLRPRSLKQLPCSNLPGPTQGVGLRAKAIQIVYGRENSFALSEITGVLPHYLA